VSIFDIVPFLITMLWRGTRLKSIEQGTATSVTVATSSEIKQGGYYADCLVAEETTSAKLDENNAALFDYCDEVTKQLQ
jgi:hypothetical protein